jgi:hypothetical protein
MRPVNIATRTGGAVLAAVLTAAGLHAPAAHAVAAADTVAPTITDIGLAAGTRPGRGRVEPGQPVGQMLPVGRGDPAAFPFTALVVDQSNVSCFRWMSNPPTIDIRDLLKLRDHRCPTQGNLRLS